MFRPIVAVLGRMDCSGFKNIMRRGLVFLVCLITRLFVQCVCIFRWKKDSVNESRCDYKSSKKLQDLFVDLRVASVIMVGPVVFLLVTFSRFLIHSELNIFNRVLWCMFATLFM